MSTGYTLEPPVERHEGGVDWRRVLVEADQAGIERRPGIKFRRTDSSIEIHDDVIGVVGTIPLYRVLSFDPDALIPMTQATVNDPTKFTALEARYIVREINAERAEVTDEPDSDYVLVSAAGYKLCAIHRRCLIPSWPMPDAA